MSVQAITASVAGDKIKVNRLASIDAFRGLVMLLMWGEGCRFYQVAQQVPYNKFWQFVNFQANHVSWSWASMHDMIQPAFTFLAGVSLPFSIASRLKRGDSKKSIIIHAIKRSLILVFLGVFLRSMGDKQTYFTFEDTLSQIGLGYTFLVLLGFKSQRTQIIALVVILFGYWLAWALYPLPPANFDYTKVGVDADWPYHAKGFAAHWNLNSNLGWAFDTWFLNLFPRKEKFLFHPGAYYTLNFIPTLCTMILGALCGNILKNKAIKGVDKIKRFVLIGLSILLAGIFFHKTGICPVVKRMWTPSWVLCSGGLCFLFMAIFYGVIDIYGVRKWSFPLVVIGANSIMAYCMADAGMRSFFGSALHTHLGQNYDKVFGDPYATVVNGVLVIFLMWLILYWMYKKRVFIKI